MRLIEEDESIHGWFGLSYASYLVLPRSILQSAPNDLQKRIVACLDELYGIFGDVPVEGKYEVRLRTDKGRYLYDDLRNYERGRRIIFPSKGRKEQETV